MPPVILSIKTPQRFLAGIVVAPLIFVAQTLQANPTVDGNTISWPDDGWYQVQTADGQSSLCEGGNSCEVDPGTYLVINHTTGERFPGIRVEGSSGSTTVAVNGNTISWPDDGWYQVQTADGSTSICNGGRSCEVDPGIYLVINHTTGERFHGIRVEGSSGSTAISVNGNTISWPDDGWYQVQTVDGQSSLCEGGSSCEVDPGTYLVINHTTGERFEGVTVTGSSTATISPAEKERLNEVLNILSFDDVHASISSLRKYFGSAQQQDGFQNDTEDLFYYYGTHMPEAATIPDSGGHRTSSANCPEGGSETLMHTGFATSMRYVYTADGCTYGTKMLTTVLRYKIYQRDYNMSWSSEDFEYYFDGNRVVIESIDAEIFHNTTCISCSPGPDLSFRHDGFNYLSENGTSNYRAKICTENTMVSLGNGIAYSQDDTGSGYDFIDVPAMRIEMHNSGAMFTLNADKDTSGGCAYDSSVERLDGQIHLYDEVNSIGYLLEVNEDASEINVRSSADGYREIAKIANIVKSIENQPAFKFMFPEFVHRDAF